MSGARLIGLDWGTSACRAYLLGADGAVLERLTDGPGIMKVQQGRFGVWLDSMIGGWIATHGVVPVVLSGMIGSRQGWHEAPYAHCPAGADELVAGVARFEHDGLALAFVPGLSCENDGMPDVMRGEETQLYGLWLQSHADRLCVLPGTHAKWAEIKGDGVAGFRTYMTGEVFANLSSTGTIAQLIRKDAPHDATAFRRGVAASEGQSAGGLLNRLFSARTLGLFAELPGEAIASYLSGLLIGAEVRDALNTAGTSSQPIAVIGSARMNALYLEGLALLGAKAEAIDGDTLLRPALLEIGRQAGLM